MGKQSKLKKTRKNQLSEIQKPKDVNSDVEEVPHLNEFINNIEKHGYSLKKIQQSPEIPENQIEPKV